MFSRHLSHLYLPCCFAAFLLPFCGSGQEADFALVRKAAEQGNAKAQIILAGMYSKDLGVRQDYAEAVLWYRKPPSRGTL
jgi:TPR repeat protein